MDILPPFWERCGTHYGVATSVTGANRYAIYAENSNSSGYAGYFQGDVTVTGNFANPSDKQFKKDIVPLSTALGKILKLQPRSYYFKPELAKKWGFSEDLQAGFIAQELEEIIPHLVMKESHTPRHLEDEIDKDVIDDPTEYKSVNYLGCLLSLKLFKNSKR
ncbi:MAG: tail fiber domain-containing protein [Chitinophagales bacterium]